MIDISRFPLYYFYKYIQVMLFISPPQNQPDQSFQGGIAFSLSLSLSLSLYLCAVIWLRERRIALGEISRLGFW